LDARRHHRHGGWNYMKCARERYICRAFHFIGHWCVEKCMPGFRIDSHAIKMGKLVCITVI
jgi:hypothetical protein